MKSLIARQPILDKNMKIQAYELLYRSSSTENFYSNNNADQASSRIVMESFHNMGLETLTGNKTAFINFTTNLLLEDVATLFPKEKLVIEVLENVKPSKEVVAACQRLHEKGFKIALDDFIYTPELAPLIDICDVIKFDFLQSSVIEIREMLKYRSIKTKVLLAEKIETMEMFETAKSLGFTLFQGYFFKKPVILESQEIAPLKINHLALLKEVNTGKELDYKKISSIISNDVALSYKLLRLVNSAFYSRRNRVTDIERAVVIVGSEEIYKWISLISMIGLSEDKPDEVVRMSMIRGKFLENMKPVCKLQSDEQTIFLVGLFSMIDVLMGKSMNDVLETLILPDPVRVTLVERKGKLHTILLLVIAIERGDWAREKEICDFLKIDTEKASDAYLEAIQWMNEIPF